MVISKTDFQNALREVVSSQFSHIPTSEDSINFEFSEKFIKRMERLIRSQKKAYWKFINTASKRVAVLLIVLLTMITSALSVKAIREPVVIFFKEVYESFTRYFFEGDTTDTISKEYTLPIMPEGFKEIDKIRSDISVTTVMANDCGNTIQLTQTITDETLFDLDNKNGVKHQLIVDGNTIQILESENFIQAVWIKDVYCFNLTAYGNFNIEDIEKIIMSIQ